MDASGGHSLSDKHRSEIDLTFVYGMFSAIRKNRGEFPH